MNVMTRWSADRAGCIWAGASSRTSDELNALIILTACEEGWTEHDGTRPDAEALLAQESATGVLWAECEEVSQWLTDGADKAIAWLNEHVAPLDHVFVLDDGLYLWEEED